MEDGEVLRHNVIKGVVGHVESLLMVRDNFLFTPEIS
jgi:hypothetical protein